MYIHFIFGKAEKRRRRFQGDHEGRPYISRGHQISLFFSHPYRIMEENSKQVKGHYMATSSTNPNVEAIRLSVHRSCTELLQLIDGPLAALEPDRLYKSPAENEWSIMQNLAHIVEFMPYWANEIEKLVANPGRNFGRTAQDEGRLRAIKEHGRDSLEQI